jgi:hypothetical protein
MALFLSTAADSMNALIDLFSIVRCDANLGQNDIPGFVRITYAKSGPGAGQDRIEELVGVGPAISVHALTSGTNVPDGTGNMVPINLVGGVTFPAVADNLSANHIQVAYCFDNEMFAFDANVPRQKISLPRSVILFHELSHAFHRADGTFNAGDPEFQAETDENLYRAQVGLALRNPNDHDGGEGASNGQTVPGCSGMQSPPGQTPTCSC